MPSMDVTTLIPAYKPKYLMDLLTGFRHQTVKPKQIIFSDDSPDQAFIQALSQEPIRSAVQDLNISVVRGLCRGGLENCRHLLNVWQRDTALFHILLDDDVIYPTFYQQHITAHASGQIQCSVSRRWTALESGFPVDDLPVPELVRNHPQRLLSLTSDAVFSSTAAVSANWFGEFSNAVFSVQMADTVQNPTLAGISFIGLEDLGAFLNASLQAPLGYINEHLGFFRRSAEQNSANPMGWPMKLAHLAYLALAIAGRNVGQLSAEQCRRCLANLAPLVVLRYGTQDDMQRYCALMPALATGSEQAEAAFLEVWAATTWHG